MTTPSATAVLSAQALDVGVEDKALLAKLSVTIAPGERIAVVGPSGCGKTTLLRVLAGFEDARGGAIRLEGQGPDDLGWPMYRRHVVFVHQRPVMRDGTVEDNLRFPFVLLGRESHYPQDRATELMGRMGMADISMSQEATSLSEGQQQRLALIRALLTEPKVLLLDEPTSALDAATCAKVEQTLIVESDQRKAAIFWITHDAEQANRACHRSLDCAGYQP